MRSSSIKIMTNEDRQKQMDFILEQQAKFTIDIQLLQEAHAVETKSRQEAQAAETKARQEAEASLTKRMSQLESGFVSFFNMMDRTAKAQQENAAQIVALTEAQRETGERLNAFILVLEDSISTRRNGRSGKKRSPAPKRPAAKRPATKKKDRNQ